MYHNSLSNPILHQRPRRHAACHTQQPNLGHLSTPRHLRLPQCRSASNGGFDSAYDRLEAISISLKAFPEVEFFQITAILRPWRLNGVIKALNSQGIRGLTVSDVAGIGFQGGKERYGGTEFGGSDLIEKKKLDIVCERTQVDDICRCIAVAAYTGELGDGKIFCYPVADIVRIRTAETGGQAERMAGGRADRMSSDEN
eukprot:jgi/Ulvmu1/5637/UM023_0177.1